MTPDELRAAVRGHAPSDDRERCAKDRFLAELARLPHPFDRHADPTHVTASAIVVGPRGVLLHLHQRLGVWMQPGGHVDPGEDPPAAARRETREETGVAAEHPASGPQLVHLDVHRGGRGHLHLDLRYLLLAGDADPAPPRGESQQVDWYPWDRALEVADAGLVGGLRAQHPYFRRAGQG